MIDIEDFPTKDNCRKICHEDIFGINGIDYTNTIKYINGKDKISEETVWYVDGRAKKTITIYHEDGTYDRTIVEGIEEKIDGNHYRILEKSRHEEKGIWKMMSEPDDNSV